MGEDTAVEVRGNLEALGAMHEVRVVGVVEWVAVADRPEPVHRVALYIENELHHIYSLTDARRATMRIINQRRGPMAARGAWRTP